MALAGLYRRLLPSPPAIEFASNEGKQLFREAFENGTMEGFFKLISYYQTQSEPAFCGLASLSMVLNALAIDPRRKWKGPWRWFDDSMLECCEPLEKIKASGITLGKVVCLAHCAGAQVEAYRTIQSNINDFRKYVTRCSASSDCHLIASYHRAAFKQTGSGHFSPIGGYHAERDMVLILDVARFKYPPHWVPLPLLWEAMDYIDETTNQNRGFMLVSRSHRNAALLYTLSCKHESWVHVAKYLMDEVPLLLASKDVIDLQSVLSIVIMSQQSNFSEFVKWIAEVRRQEDGSQGISQEEKARINIKEEILKLVRETLLFKHVSAFLSNSCRGKMVNLGTGNTLPSIAAHVCCQGAELLGGKSNSSGGYCCEDTCVKCLESNDSRPVTVVSGTVVNGNSEQGVDVLVPSSHRKRCCLHSSSHDNMSMHPASEDILTVLLLSLPKETWVGIKEKKLLQEVYNLVSTENLPTLLQEEVLHLRRQLHLLKRCLDDRVDDELGAPLC